MKILVVDDEPMARSALVRLCESSQDTLVIGEADTGVGAIAAAEKLRPDVMLVGVDLPDVTGFDVLRAMQGQAGLHGIMVAAHDQHAVAAFAAGAIDYLIKPVTLSRFAISLDRARERFGTRPANNRQLTAQGEIVETPRASSTLRDLLIGEREHRLYPLNPQTIDYIESDGNYVSMRIGSTAYIRRDSIRRLSTVLAEFGFFRIERSLLVNIRAVLYIEQVGRGGFTFTLSSGASLHSSFTYREQILRVLPLGPLPKRHSSHSV